MLGDTDGLWVGEWWMGEWQVEERASSSSFPFPPGVPTNNPFLQDCSSISAGWRCMSGLLLSPWPPGQGLWYHKTSLSVYFVMIVPDPLFLSPSSISIFYLEAVALKLFFSPRVYLRPPSLSYFSHPRECS